MVKYSLNNHGNFLYILKDGDYLTGCFDSYERTDLQKIVDELNSQEDIINQLKKYCDLYYKLCHEHNIQNNCGVEK